MGLFVEKAILYGRDAEGICQEVPTDTGGLLRVNAQDYVYAIAEGRIPNHEMWSKIGYHSNIGATELTLAPWTAGKYVFPAAAVLMSIRSSDNLADIPAGTGARTVIIYYLDTLYIEKQVTVNLNGTTWVDITNPDIFRIQNIRVTITGTAGVPAGNITLADTATKGVTYGYISAGETRQRQLVWTVPKSKELYLLSFTASAIAGAANKWVRLTLRATYDDKSKSTLTPGVLFMAYSEIFLSLSSQYIGFPGPLKFPAGTDLKVDALANQASSTASCALRGWVEVDV